MRPFRLFLLTTLLVPALLRAEGDTIQLELRSDEAIRAERFPFDFVLTSIFRLEGKTVHHTLRVENPGEGELRFGIGYHPAFAIPFDGQHTTADYEFRFDQPESPVILDARPNGLLSGKCYYQWKNADRIPLTDDLFANVLSAMEIDGGLYQLTSSFTVRTLVTSSWRKFPKNSIWEMSYRSRTSLAQASTSGLTPNFSRREKKPLTNGPLLRIKR